MTWQSRILWLISALVLAGFVLTAGRSPLTYGDDSFYASIARSVQLRGIGVPTVLENAPTAVDHVPFYGPIFFRLVATLFAAFGFSLVTMRTLAIAGALLIAVSGAAMVDALGGSRERAAWVCAILLLSPELGAIATLGRMDSLAVGLQMLALAIFLRGLTHPDRPRTYGAMAGVALAASALTTPRAFPFIFGFVVAGLVTLPRALASERRGATRQLLTAVLVVTALFGAWTIAAWGSPWRWLRFMIFIATHENRDVALVPGGELWIWSILPQQVITPLVAVVGACLVFTAGRARSMPSIAAAFALVATSATLAVTLVAFDQLLFVAVYGAVPLLGAVLAVPMLTTEFERRARRVVFTTLLVGYAGLRLVQYTEVMATWTSRDPAPLERFVAAHVPPGSEVIGPAHLYYFMVERAGSRYLNLHQRSAADWARWVPNLDWATPLRRIEERDPHPRFLLWPVARPLAPGPLPAKLWCALGEEIATYQSAPADWPRIARWLPRLNSSYPSTRLYALEDTCAPPSEK